MAKCVSKLSYQTYIQLWINSNQTLEYSNAEMLKHPKAQILKYLNTSTLQQLKHLHF